MSKLSLQLTQREIFRLLYFEDGFNFINHELSRLCTTAPFNYIELLHLLKFIGQINRQETGFWNHFNAKNLKTFLNSASLSQNECNEGVLDEIIENAEIISCHVKTLSKTISAYSFQPPYELTLNKSKTKILIKQIDRPMVGHSEIGFSLWPSATIIAHLFDLFPYLVTNKSCLEIGAGLGLCGIAAAKFAKHVDITDYKEEVLYETLRNVHINTGSCVIHNSSGIIRNNEIVDVKQLDCVKVFIVKKSYAMDYILPVLWI